MPAAAKYALTYLFVQAEFGLCCPLSMTDSLTRTLRKFGDPALVERYLPQLTTQDFDDLCQGAMFMTEQAAGSDIAATLTRAVPDGDAFRLHGDKWFCSNPDAGLAMVLARIEGAPEGMKGVSLFLLPRTLPDGSANAYRIIRLKDKLGTRSMASGEIRLEGARAWLVGEPGRGFVQMADMVNNSRLSNGVRAAGLMRRALSEASFIARERRAFGKRLVDMPLMRRQLLKLTLPTEQARTMVFQTAEALRRSDAGEDGAYALVRILTPLIKFRACRDARKVTGRRDGSARRLRLHRGLERSAPGARRPPRLDLGRHQQHRRARRAAGDPSRQVAAGAGGASQGHVARDAPARRCARGVRADAGAHAGSRGHAAEAEAQGDVLARQVASSLYHLTTAIAMAWEAAGMRSTRRMHLAQLVLRQRVLPQDPLGGDESEPAWLPALLEPEAEGADAARIESINLF